MRYKVLFIDKNKVLNMRTFKYLFLIGLFSLLILPIGKSTIVDLTGSAAIQVPIDTPTTNWVRISQFIWDEDISAWFGIYSDSTTSGDTYICKFDYTFNTLLQNCQNVYTEAIPTGSSLINYNTTHMLVIFTSGGLIKNSWFTKADLTKKTESKTANGIVGLTAAVDGTIVQQNISSTYCMQICYNYIGSGCSNLFIPANHCNSAYKQWPRNLQWLYIPNTEQYYLFYTVSNSTSDAYDKAYLVIYDANQDDAIYGNQPKRYYHLSRHIGNVLFFHLFVKYHF
jgi:hypothetical protein